MLLPAIAPLTAMLDAAEFLVTHFREQLRVKSALRSSEGPRSRAYVGCVSGASQSPKPRPLNSTALPPTHTTGRSEDNNPEGSTSEITHNRRGHPPKSDERDALPRRSRTHRDVRGRVGEEGDVRPRPRPTLRPRTRPRSHVPHSRLNRPPGDAGAGFEPGRGTKADQSKCGQRAVFPVGLGKGASR